MSQFTEPLVVELIGKNLWRVYKEFEYHIGTYPSEEVIKVPAGFVTNFASVPRFLWPIISPIDTHGKAAVVHDYCYSKNNIYTRKRSDLIFREGMGVLEVKPWKVWCMFWAVRSCGWYPWWKGRLNFGGNKND